MEISASVHWVFQILGEALGFLSIKDSLLEGLIAYVTVFYLIFAIFTFQKVSTVCAICTHGGLESTEIQKKMPGFDTYIF